MKHSVFFFLAERLELGASDLERLNAEEPRVLAQMARRDAGMKKPCLGWKGQTFRRSASHMPQHSDRSES